MDHLEVFAVIQRSDSISFLILSWNKDSCLLQKFLHLGHTLFCEGYVLAFLIQLEVSSFIEGGVELPIHLLYLGKFIVVSCFRILLALLEEWDYGFCSLCLGTVVLSLAADDKGSPGFIDKDGVDFVDDTEVVLRLDLSIH